jgi:SAM-dependent methyltransferase
LDLSAYEVTSRVEETHWWFVGRRKLFQKIIQELDLGPDARVLDVGSETGSNLRLLQSLEFGKILGLDREKTAIDFCFQKGLPEVLEGDACDLPFEDDSFELVLATDILEHLEDDSKAVDEIVRVLVPGGRAIFTVPRFAFLWGALDELSQHKKRYEYQQFKKLIHDSPLIDIELSCFNFILFLPILLVRKTISFLGIKEKNDNDINSTWLNKILKKIFFLDIGLSRRISPFFGAFIPSVSLLAVAKKPIVNA